MICPHCKGIVRPNTPQQNGYHFHCFLKEKKHVIPVQPLRGCDNRKPDNTS